MSVGVPDIVEQSPDGKAGRRRRSYSAEQKRQLVEEARQPGASVSLVARRHDINANLLFTWRRQLRDARAAAPADSAGEGMQFIPLGVVGQGTGRLAALAKPALTVEERTGTRPTAPPEHTPAVRRNGMIEIALPNGIRLRVGNAIEAAALRQVITVLKEAW